MYVCLCHAVTDSQIAQALAAGADARMLRQTLKVGTQCGGCNRAVRHQVQRFYQIAEPGMSCSGLEAAQVVALPSVRAQREVA